MPRRFPHNQFTNGTTSDVNQEELNDLELKLKARLGLEPDTPQPWRLAPSPTGGRGVLATRDIVTGEIIFVDTPIVKGPRAGLEEAVCSLCLLPERRLSRCPSGCRLPLCPQCSASHPNAAPECKYLREAGIPQGEAWSPELYRALTPIKCLTLPPDEADVVALMQPIASQELSLEVKLLKRGLGKELDKEEEEWMDRCCKVLDSVAFEAFNGHINSKSSLRGLFPLAGMLNHGCSPNTRHYNDQEGRLVLVASKGIKEGEELSTSYCPTLWATHVRTRFLSKTKQFTCRCQRCQHPTELETYLSALGCGGCEGEGLILPMEPLDPKSIWKCNKCDKKLTSGQADLALVLLAQANQPKATTNNNNNNNGIFLPRFNHVNIETSLVRLVKTSETIQSLSDDELKERETTIQKIINILDKLSLGECRTRGILYYELYSTLKENAERKHILNTSEKEYEFYLRSAAKILEGDASVPHHIQKNFIKTNSV